ncbi:MAG: 2-dehydropantoate 2-reductase [Myxococcota bacterium]
MALSVGVFGAGAIGGYLGVRLSAAGAVVTLVGRRSLVELRPQLRAVALDGTELRPASSLRVSDDPGALASVDLALVTVKSRATAEAAEILAHHLEPEVTVVSFQNGLSNASTLRRALGPRVVAGMVSFNVSREDGGACLRQATRGPVVSGSGHGEHADRMRSLAATFEAGGLPLNRHERIDDVLAGKLLLNLNNGVCAATGLAITDSLRSRDTRWCLAQCMLEGLATLRRAGYRPTSVLGLPPGLIARTLLLPDAILLRIARRMVSAEPGARLSTLQDLDAGKPTEIDQLNGAIATLARTHGMSAPANATITKIVHELEGRTAPLPFVTPRELRTRITARMRDEPRPTT